MLKTVQVQGNMKKNLGEKAILLYLSIRNFISVHQLSSSETWFLSKVYYAIIKNLIKFAEAFRYSYHS